MISKACKYGIRAAIFVASKKKEGLKFNIKQIAREVDAPEAFTAKILQVLNKNKVVTSLKGPYGGFYIEDYQLDQPVINIVSAIDGMAIFKECGLGLKQCSSVHPCPLHDQYKIARDALMNAFQKTSIRQLAEQVNDGGFYINNLNLMSDKA